MTVEEKLVGLKEYIADLEALHQRADLFDGSEPEYSSEDEATKDRDRLGKMIENYQKRALRLRKAIIIEQLTLAYSHFLNENQGDKINDNDS